MKTNRRSTFKKFALGIAGLLGFSVAKAASADSEKVVTGEIYQDGQTPLFSSSVKHGGLVYVAGKGAHFDGDITAHTRHVLDEIEKELKKAGSSMEKVLKVNVYLHDLADYKAMNEAYRGRFGKNPPVRTTVAVYGGVPGDSLVEMDCIAYV
ncbi:MAG TPA: RidA family protein [Cyclobacteriaceae bacterium]|nr:RidA family protein [Cyclobacteriaceae bacterium]